MFVCVNQKSTNAAYNTSIFVHVPSKLIFPRPCKRSELGKSNIGDVDVSRRSESESARIRDISDEIILISEAINFRQMDAKQAVELTETRQCLRIEAQKT